MANEIISKQTDPVTGIGLQVDDSGSLWISRCSCSIKSPILFRPLFESIYLSVLFIDTLDIDANAIERSPQSGGEEATQ
ncbi:hypothetical protein [Brevibacterium aurantiacum]|uniref:hypothetical protein n=1 Tax=Brevibacterium aurantiacum TaxID=273384 RepID=UPI001869642C|nr:hypothetical protein [Brevibacterium aurantiacum]